MTFDAKEVTFFTDLTQRRRDAEAQSFSYSPFAIRYSPFVAGGGAFIRAPDGRPGHQAQLLAGEKKVNKKGDFTRGFSARKIPYKIFSLRRAKRAEERLGGWRLARSLFYKHQAQQ